MFFGGADALGVFDEASNSFVGATGIDRLRLLFHCFPTACPCLRLFTDLSHCAPLAFDRLSSASPLTFPTARPAPGHSTSPKPMSSTSSGSEPTVFKTPRPFLALLPLALPLALSLPFQRLSLPIHLPFHLPFYRLSLPFNLLFHRLSLPSFHLPFYRPSLTFHLPFPPPFRCR